MSQSEYNHLAGKVAIVTGGAKRVGREIALQLAGAGMDIVLHYHHSEDEARATASEIEKLGKRVLLVQCDLARSDAADQFYDAVTGDFDRVDALINNASCFAAKPIGQITHDDVQKNMAVNAVAPLMLIQKFAPLLGAHFDADDPTTTGRIVNFIDIHVMGQPLKGYLPYNVSKAALQEITHTAAMELAPHVTVNACAPGVVAWADEYTDQMKREYMTRVPLSRPGTPRDAAGAVLYLVRDAHYCTGQTIRLDGGRGLT